MARVIVVLNDGESWCDAVDCCITVVTNEGYDALVEGKSPQDLEDDAIVDLGLKVFPNTGAY